MLLRTLAVFITDTRGVILFLVLLGPWVALALVVPGLAMILIADVIHVVCFPPPR